MKLHKMSTDIRHWLNSKEEIKISVSMTERAYPNKNIMKFFSISHMDELSYFDKI